ncbi:hypothetical protein QQ045_017020 [Rhodiola kirilowii]
MVVGFVRGGGGCVVAMIASLDVTVDESEIFQQLYIGFGFLDVCSHMGALVVASCLLSKVDIDELQNTGVEPSRKEGLSLCATCIRVTISVGAGRRGDCYRKQLGSCVVTFGRMSLVIVGQLVLWSVISLYSLLPLLYSLVLL